MLTVCKSTNAHISTYQHKVIAFEFSESVPALLNRKHVTNRMQSWRIFRFFLKCPNMFRNCSPDRTNAISECVSDLLSVLQKSFELARSQPLSFADSVSASRLSPGSTTSKTGVKISGVDYQIRRPRRYENGLRRRSRARTSEFWTDELNYAYGIDRRALPNS